MDHEHPIVICTDSVSQSITCVHNIYKIIYHVIMCIISFMLLFSILVVSKLKNTRPVILRHIIVLTAKLTMDLLCVSCQEIVLDFAIEI